MRVVVAGARRARQGIGAFVARALVDCGCEVAGVVGTSGETAGEAAAALGSRRYVDLSAAIDRERPDLVAICTPIEAHADQLEVVAEAGCHCLCDKPLMWPGGDRLAGILDGFEGNQKHLGVLVQWPKTLDCYFQLYPDLEGEAVSSFEMRLSPSSTGARMLLDSLSHPLSILEQLCGRHRASDVDVSFAGKRCLARFVYSGTRCEVILEHVAEAPRPAGYSINGRTARRVIGDDYAMFLEDETGNRVAMPDPMPLRVREVVEAARAGVPTDRASLELGMQNLADLLVGLTP